MRRFGLIVSLLFAVFSSGATAGEIHDAARGGNVERIKELISTGINVNEASTFGTALHFAAIGNQIEVVKFLIDAGADVDASSDALGTPLHVAAQYGAAEIASALIDAGADVGARSKFEFTPLHTAAFNGSTQVAKVLLNAGADAKALAYSTGTGTFESGYFEPLQLSEKHGNTAVSEQLRLFGGGPRVVEPAGEMVAKADPIRGRMLAYEGCGKCHVLEAGDPDNTNNFGGPPVIAMFGKSVAAVEGYNYSPALMAFGGKWTEDRLYAWILHPMLTAPGVRMPEVKRFSPEDVADIVAYMKSVAN